MSKRGALPRRWRRHPSPRRNEGMHDIRIGLCGFTMAFEDYVRELPVVEVLSGFAQFTRSISRIRRQPIR